MCGGRSNWVPEGSLADIFGGCLIGFGDIHGPKPYKFMGFDDIHGPKPYKFIGFGDIHGPKPYKFIGFGGWPAPGAREGPSKRWGASPPTFLKAFPGPLGAGQGFGDIHGPKPYYEFIGFGDLKHALKKALPDCLQVPSTMRPFGPWPSASPPEAPTRAPERYQSSCCRMGASQKLAPQNNSKAISWQFGILNSPAKRNPSGRVRVPEFLWFFGGFGRFPWVPGLLSYPPGPISESVFLWLCLCRQKPPCRRRQSLRRIGDLTCLRTRGPVNSSAWSTSLLLVASTFRFVVVVAMLHVIVIITARVHIVVVVFVALGILVRIYRTAHVRSHKDHEPNHKS
jgi:hypothetical protein